VFLYLDGFPGPTAWNLTFTRSVGFAIALPIAPEIAPEVIFFHIGVFAGSRAPSDTLIGS